MDDAVYAQLYALEEEHWWFRGRRAVIWALLSGLSLPRPARVLDAGCGTGRNLIEYGGLGQACGVDPSPQAVAFCYKRGLDNVQQAGLEPLPFEDASFDLLLALDVIEHIDVDDQALCELRRVAAPGGRMVITVPAYQWLWSHHDEAHHHQRRYTLRQLAALVARTGWRVERATYFNSVLLVPIAAVRALAGRNSAATGNGDGSPVDGTGTGSGDYDRTPRALNRLLELPMRAEARAISRGARLPAGVSIAMVCAPA